MVCEKYGTAFSCACGVGSGTAHLHGCVRWRGGLVMDVCVASSDGEAPPSTGLGVVPAVGGIDACVWYIREGRTVHVGVEGVHAVVPGAADRACSWNGRTGDELLIVGVCEVCDDVGLAA